MENAINEVPSEPTPAPAQVPPAEPVEPVAPVAPVVPPAHEVIPKEKYDASVKGMNEAQRRAARAEQALEELLRREKAAPVQRNEPFNPATRQYTEDEKAKLCEYYGVSDFRQIQLQLDAAQLVSGVGIQNLKKDFDDLSSTIYEEKYQSTKEKLKSKDVVFEKFEPEIEARLNKLPLRDRIKPDTIERERRVVFNEHFEEILELTKQQAKEEALRGLTAQPPSIPSVSSVSGGGASRTQKTTLTAAQRAITERMGLNVDEVEKVSNGQVAPSNWSRHLA